jgi:uncharacterized protein YecE (DUF72 family)
MISRETLRALQREMGQEFHRGGLNLPDWWANDTLRAAYNDAAHALSLAMTAHDCVIYRWNGASGDQTYIYTQRDLDRMAAAVDRLYDRALAAWNSI